VSGGAAGRAGRGRSGEGLAGGKGEVEDKGRRRPDVLADLRSVGGAASWNQASSPPLRRRAAAWFWTGPLGHLLGGGLDLVEALARYAAARLRGRPLN